MKKNVLIGTGLTTLALAAAITPTLLKAAQPPKAAVPAPVRINPTNFRYCGTIAPTRAEKEKVEGQIKAFQDGTITSSASLRSVHLHAPGSIMVKVYWHVIKSSSGEGNVTPQMMQKQIDVLNTAYSGQDKERAPGQGPSGQPTANMPYRFVLAGSDVTVNDTWFGNNDDDAMKTALHKGTKQDFNVYTTNLVTVSGGVLGYATFPQDVVSRPKLDGVVMDYNTVPGGSLPGYDHGDVLTHELGHWVGLYHTHSDGNPQTCEDEADYVNDTPRESTRYFDAAPPYVDTCTGKLYPGRDPIENFMAYSLEVSKFQFTPGQATRSDLVCQLFRGF